MSLAFTVNAWSTVAITVTNPSFEADVVADGARLVFPAAPAGWIGGYYEDDGGGNPDLSTWTLENGYRGAFNPGLLDAPFDATDGDNVAYCEAYTGYYTGLSQVLGDTLLPDLTYDLSVKVGNPALVNGGIATAPYRIELLAGGTVVDSDSGASPATNAWATVSLSYPSPSGGDPLIGQPLSIRIFAADGTTGLEVDFDEVSLTRSDITSPIPIAGGPYTLPPGGSLSLDGSGSVPSDGETFTLYEWDLDNDGTYDVFGVTPAAITEVDLMATYGLGIGSNPIVLRVTDTGAGGTVTTTDTVTLTVFPAAVAYWPMRDGAPGDTVTGADDVIDDASHPATDGTVSGNSNATWEADATRGIVYSTGEGNRLLAGTQGINMNVDSGFTWSIWAKMSSSNITDPGADCMMGTRNGAWNKMDRSGTSNWVNPTYPDFADDTWHHWVYVGDTSGASVYRDGVLQSTDSSYNGGPLLDKSALRLEIGGTSQFSEDVTGLISDVAIWKVALTPSEITDLFNGQSVVDDLTAPVLAATTPEDDDPEAPYEILQAIFDEPVVIGTGDIRIVDLTVPGTDTIAVTDGAQVVVSGASVTITPTTPLVGGHDYAIEMDAGVVKNLSAGLDFAGILDQTTWNFTADDLPPTLVAMDDAVAGGPIYEDLSVLAYTVTFNEPIDGASVDATDFDNAGTATISIGTVTQTAPEVFTVDVQPSTTGTLQLRIPVGSVVLDESGNTLVVPVSDNDTIDILGGPSPTVTITGTASGNDSWNDPANWDSGFVPYDALPATVAAGITAKVQNALTPVYDGGLTLLSGSQLEAMNVSGSENAFGTGTVTLNTGSVLKFQAGYSFTIPGDIVFAGDASLLNGGNSTDNDQRTLAGVISGGGLFTYGMRRGNILHLDGANTWSGGFIANYTDNNFGNASRVQPGDGGLGTGDVTLNDGISLEILGGLSDTVDDGAALILNGRGRDNQKVKLSSDETVNELWLDNTVGDGSASVQLAAGAYTQTSSPSGPAILDITGAPLIFGSGTLTVLTGSGAGNDYSDWIALFPGVGGDTGFNDDPDGDGSDNGLENFYGTAPDEFSSGLISGTTNGAGTEFTFTHPQNATPADDITGPLYTWSTDLVTFTDSGVANGGSTVTFVASENDPVLGTTTVTATVTGVALDTLFAQVGVTTP